MKKIFAVLLAVVLTFASVLTVLAQPSVTVDGVITVNKGYDVDGNEVEVRVDELTEDDLKLVSDLLKPENLKNILGDDYSDLLQVIDKKDVYIWDESVGKIHYSEKPELFPVTIEFNVPGVTADKNVSILQYVDGAWKVVDGIALGNGTVTAKFNKLGPVVFLSEAASGTSSSVSPLTGDNNFVLFASLLGAAALAVSVTAIAKKKNA